MADQVPGRPSQLLVKSRSIVPCACLLSLKLPLPLKIETRWPALISATMASVTASTAASECLLSKPVFAGMVIIPDGKGAVCGTVSSQRCRLPCRLPMPSLT